MLTPPGIEFHTSEDSISTALEGSRTATWNTITLAWSLIGSQGGIIGVGIIVAALILGRTKNWRLAAVPVVATILQQAIFLIAANIVDRPRPQVAHLDEAPPTASFPSGHVGASTTLYLTFALLALQIRTGWLRRLTMIVCLAVPLLVAFGRLYRGMHHLTDIGAAFLNGITCAVLPTGGTARANARVPRRLLQVRNPREARALPTSRPERSGWAGWSVQSP